MCQRIDIISEKSSQEKKGSEVVTPLVGGAAPASSASGGVYRRSDLVNGGLPPACNTGVTHTKGSAEISVDWLSMTVLPVVETSLNVILGWFSPDNWLEDDWVELHRGGLGYRSCMERGNIRVYHDGQPGMGVHVVLSSQALRQVEQEEHLFGEEAWVNYLRFLRSKGVRFTRADVALDDFGKDAVLDMAVIEEKARAKHLVSLFHDVEKRSREKWSLDSSNNFAPDKGETLYFGSRSSNMFVRIYNKGAQMGVPFQWTRVEMEAKKEAAEQLIDRIIGEGFAVAPRILRAQLEFKEASDTDTNKSRWVTCEWWDTFLGRCEKSRLRVAKAVSRSIETGRAWLDRQASAMLAVVLDAIDKECKVTGADYQRAKVRYLNGLVERGREKYKGRHRSMLAGYVPSLAFGKGVA